jgi:hypothetical protein
MAGRTLINYFFDDKYLVYVIKHLGVFIKLQSRTGNCVVVIKLCLY